VIVSSVSTKRRGQTFGEHKIKGNYPISYADAFAVATAIERLGILVTGDPELKRLEKDKKVEILWIQNG
jgi:predicted nucleic acid-binding protein